MTAAQKLTTRQIADELGTTPKALRRFLRTDDTFGGVGSGSRYEFTKRDLPRLKKRFEAFAETKPTRARRSGVAPMGEGEPGMPASILRGKQTAATKAEIRRRSEERINRLEERLKAAGLHLSQQR